MTKKKLMKRMNNLDHSLDQIKDLVRHCRRAEICWYVFTWVGVVGLLGNFAAMLWYGDNLLFWIGMIAFWFLFISFQVPKFREYRKARIHGETMGSLIEQSNKLVKECVMELSEDGEKAR